MLDKSSLHQLITNILNPRQVLPGDIPDIELYMDQVTTFMETRLSGCKRDEKEKILTKTMINNYTKAGLLIPPHKKKYSKENMMLLILIYQLKHVLSMNDIAALFFPLLKGKLRQETASPIDATYSLYLDLEKNNHEGFEEFCKREAASIEKRVGTLGDENKEQLEWLLLVLSLVHQADLQRRLAEQIIDTHFTGGV
ncbi:MAG TPA: DUF1836 domain-containing protein [Syntrophomonadaceae bacterium]|nr:DUF1836 domain-containing protein [Syntrophomonadaceae bacterium]